jgi:uncharacterized delta-60 repeat protein
MKNSTLLVATIILMSSSLVFPARFFAQDGALDLTFDADGIVTTTIGTSHERAFSVAIQSDGKIVAAGNSFNGAVVDFAVVRYNTDGSLDTSFDTDGMETTTFSPWDAYGVSAAIQADGKILVAGNIGNGANTDFILVRYNSDGSLDSSFGTDGVVTTGIGTYGDFVYAMRIQSDEKIVVAGSSDNGPNDDFALVRYNSDGSLDMTFSSDGKVTTSIGSANDVANAMVLQSDGKIVLSGVSYNGSDFDFTLVRYTANGSLDTSFDTDGKVTTDFAGSHENSYALVLQADGKILAAGGKNNGTNDEIALARYNTDGSIDTDFDTDGLQTTNMGLTSCAALSIGIAQDGKILIAGRSTADGDEDVILARYTTQGALDSSFDSDGIVTTEIGNYDEAANAIVIQMDGKIVVAGYSLNGADNDFALARYNYTSAVGVNSEPNENSDLVVYPNPCNGTFFLKNIADNSVISIYDAMGRMVLMQNVNPSGEIILPQPCSNGLYMVKVFDGQNFVEESVVFVNK